MGGKKGCEKNSGGVWSDLRQYMSRGFSFCVTKDHVSYIRILWKSKSRTRCRDLSEVVVNHVKEHTHVWHTCSKFHLLPEEMEKADHTGGSKLP